MRIRLAQFPFIVGPDASLSERERAALADLDQPSFRDDVGLQSFRLDLVDMPPWEEARPEARPASGPALIETAGERVRVSHRCLMAELEPEALRGRLFRREPDGTAVRIALRVALSARLPLAGGLPLHAAGVVLNGAGVVFFGPSGAGKTTLAATSAWPVLSDEMVAVAGAPPRLMATGFWGGIGEPGTTGEPAPLAALVELAKGPETSLVPLSRQAGFRRLLGAVLVPAETTLWGTVLGVLGRLAATVPILRLSWSPARSPWAALERALGSLGATAGRPPGRPDPLEGAVGSH